MQIILFDSSSDIEDLLKIVTKESKIYTFDYKSHILLSDKKISHEISDNLLEKSDHTTLQKISYRLAMWAQQQQISTKLTYENINVGNLFYIEFHYMLLPLLKKITEIEKIVQKNQNSTFIVSNSLYEIANFFTTTVSRFDTTKQQEQFLYDKVKIPIKFGNISINITLTKSTFVKLKNLSEKIVSIIFGLNNKIDKHKKSCLLVELDTLRYEQLLTNKSTRYSNLLLYNRRRPYVWNNKSLSILRNSDCSIITHRELSSQNTKNISYENEIKNKVSILLEEESFFNDFFVINAIKFWPIIKSRFINLCEKRIREAIHEIELAKRLFKKYNLSSVLLWSECGFNEQIILNLAKQAGIKVVLIQHGLYYDTQEAKEYNQFVGIFPEKSDKFLVWGNIMRQYAEQNNFGQKTYAVGSQFYDKPVSVTDSYDGDYILLTTTSPGQNQINDLTVEGMFNYENAIKTICETVSKLNKKLIIKLHPFQDELDITHLVKSINPNIEVLKSGSSLSLIKSCEILLSIDVSTTILEAQMMDKPTISISVKNYDFGKPSIFRSQSCLQIQINELESTLQQIISNRESKTQLVENGRRFVKDYLVNQGHASKEILSHLEQM
ncbi:hypothetical protein [Candidatus Nitrosotenuis aquarius]|uniref:hypothetical protein n=1 Tax=Candidatus Nitrosotenuis aquarius TaxID=1846278 RepID=UPI000C1EF9CD|nr:hypothetical protein [Candidatus Nitrosotenuis aquarius]